MKPTFANKEKVEAVYHGSFFLIERLNEIFKRLNSITSMRESDTDSKNSVLIWKSNLAELKSLYNELSYAMKEDLLEKHNENRNLCTKKVMNAIISFSSNKKISLDFFNDLDNWQHDLRKFAFDSGLMFLKKSEGMEAMDV